MSANTDAVTLRRAAKSLKGSPFSEPLTLAAVMVESVNGDLAKLDGPTELLVRQLVVAAQWVVGEARP